MELFKLYLDLKVLNKTTPSLYMQHLFEIIDPDTSPSILAFFHSIKDNNEEYKQAYKTVFDFFYGWRTVGRTTVKGYETSANLLKNTRNFDFTFDVERIIKLFEHLFQSARRVANKRILDLDSSCSKFGARMNTLTGTTTTHLPVINEHMLEKPGSRHASSLSINLPPLPVLEEVVAPVNADELDDEELINQNIDALILELDATLNTIFQTLTHMVIILAFSEVTGKSDVHQRHLNVAHDLASDFISYTLSSAYSIFKKDSSFNMPFSAFRNLELLEVKLKSFHLESAQRPVIDLLTDKLRGIHQVFCSIDVHVFPHFICAHPSGASVKGLDASSLDPNIWLSGGYDGLVRIHDLEPPFACYAQFSGHKSIVTDVKFAKADMIALSGSFDRTLKVWNTTNGQVIKTLVGNEEAVVSCDITGDGRWAISGGIDCTVRLWDVNAGFQVCCIKKHTKWVKVVRFTSDGKYFATAGLDAKIYIWETKLCASAGKVAEAVRGLDSHMDVVLDIALAKPSFLLSTSRDRTVRLFDYISGREVLYYTLGANRWGTACDFSADGKLFAVGTSDQNIFIFNTDKCQKVRQVRMFNMGITSIRFPKKAGAGYLAIGTAEGFIQKLLL